MTEYEIVMKLVDLEARLRKVEEDKQLHSGWINTNPQPQPTLIEAVEQFLASWATNIKEETLLPLIDKLDEALTREKRIAEAREEVIESARRLESVTKDAYRLHDALKHYDEVCNEKV